MTNQDVESADSQYQLPVIPNRGISTAATSTYNSLLDRNLQSYFSSAIIQRHLKNIGLVTNAGKVLSDLEYNRRVHLQQQRLAAQRSLAEHLEFQNRQTQLNRQLELQRQLDAVCKVEAYRRIRGESAIDKSFLVQVPPTSVELNLLRSQSTPGYRLLRNKHLIRKHSATNSDPDQNQMTTRSTGDISDAERPSSAPQETALPTLASSARTQLSSASRTYLSDLYRYSYLHKLEPTSLRSYRYHLLRELAMLKAYRERALAFQNFTGNFSSFASKGIEKSSDSVSAILRLQTGERRRWRHEPLKTASTTVPGSPPKSPTKRAYEIARRQIFLNSGAAARRRPLQPSCEIVVQYLGAEGVGAKSSKTFNGVPRVARIVVAQQHTGGNSVPVFIADLSPGDKFSFPSYRYVGYPFSLVFYENNRAAHRLSTCCESRYRPRTRLGGKHGLFRWLGVKRAIPCYKCQVLRELNAPLTTYKKKDMMISSMPPVIASGMLRRRPRFLKSLTIAETPAPPKTRSSSTKISKVQRPNAARPRTMIAVAPSVIKSAKANGGNNNDGGSTGAMTAAAVGAGAVVIGAAAVAATALDAHPEKEETILGQLEEPDTRQQLLVAAASNEENQPGSGEKQQAVDADDDGTSLLEFEAGSRRSSRRSSSETSSEEGNDGSDDSEDDDGSHHSATSDRTRTETRISTKNAYYKHDGDEQAAAKRPQSEMLHSDNEVENKLNTADEDSSTTNSDESSDDDSASEQSIHRDGSTLAKAETDDDFFDNELPQENKQQQAEDGSDQEGAATAKQEEEHDNTQNETASVHARDETLAFLTSPDARSITPVIENAMNRSQRSSAGIRSTSSSTSCSSSSASSEDPVHDPNVNADEIAARLQQAGRQLKVEQQEQQDIGTVDAAETQRLVSEAASSNAYFATKRMEEVAANIAADNEPESDGKKGGTMTDRNRLSVEQLRPNNENITESESETNIPMDRTSGDGREQDADDSDSASQKSAKSVSRSGSSRNSSRSSSGSKRSSASGSSSRSGSRSSRSGSRFSGSGSTRSHSSSSSCSSRSRSGSDSGSRSGSRSVFGSGSAVSSRSGSIDHRSVSGSKASFTHEKENAVSPQRSPTGVVKEKSEEVNQGRVVSSSESSTSQDHEDSNVASDAVFEDNVGDDYNTRMPKLSVTHHGADAEVNGADVDETPRRNSRSRSPTESEDGGHSSRKSRELGSDEHKESLEIVERGGADDVVIIDSNNAHNLRLPDGNNFEFHINAATPQESQSQSQSPYESDRQEGDDESSSSTNSKHREEEDEDKVGSRERSPDNVSDPTAGGSHQIDDPADFIEQMDHELNEAEANIDKERGEKLDPEKESMEEQTELINHEKEHGEGYLEKEPEAEAEENLADSVTVRQRRSVTEIDDSCATVVGETDQAEMGSCHNSDDNAPDEQLYSHKRPFETIEEENTVTEEEKSAADFHFDIHNQEEDRVAEAVAEDECETVEDNTKPRQLLQEEVEDTEQHSEENRDTSPLPEQQEADATSALEGDEPDENGQLQMQRDYDEDGLESMKHHQLEQENHNKHEAPDHDTENDEHEEEKVPEQFEDTHDFGSQHINDETELLPVPVEETALEREPEHEAEYEPEPELEPGEDNEAEYPIEELTDRLAALKEDLAEDVNDVQPVSVHPEEIESPHSAASRRLSEVDDAMTRRNDEEHYETVEEEQLHNDFQMRNNDEYNVQQNHTQQGSHLELEENDNIYDINEHSETYGATERNVYKSNDNDGYDIDADHDKHNDEELSPVPENELHIEQQQHVHQHGNYHYGDEKQNDNHQEFANDSHLYSYQDNKGDEAAGHEEQHRFSSHDELQNDTSAAFRYDDHNYDEHSEHVEDSPGDGTDMSHHHEKTYYGIRTDNADHDTDDSKEQLQQDMHYNSQQPTEDFPHQVDEGMHANAALEYHNDLYGNVIEDTGEHHEQHFDNVDHTDHIIGEDSEGFHDDGYGAATAGDIVQYGDDIHEATDYGIHNESIHKHENDVSYEADLEDKNKDVNHYATEGIANEEVEYPYQNNEHVETEEEDHEAALEAEQVHGFSYSSDMAAAEPEMGIVSHEHVDSGAVANTANESFKNAEDSADVRGNLDEDIIAICYSSEVEINNRDMSLSEIQAIASILATQTQIRTINFRSIGLSNEGLEKIADALQYNPSPIEVLCLNSNNITAQGVAHLTRLLPGSIRILQLSENNIGDAGATELFQYLRSVDGRTGLTRIDIGDNNLGDDGLTEIAAFLRTSSTVQKLSVSGNTIGEAGWNAFGEALQHSSSIAVLSLDYCNMKDSGCKIICEYLKGMRNLKSIDLEGNSLTDVGSNYVLELVESCPNLSSICITSGNDISTDSINRIKQIVGSRQPGGAFEQ